jgi:hypothetical protein
MKNFLTLFGGIVVVLILIVLVASKSVDGNFKYETKAVFDINKDLLWNIINNVDSYQKNKYGVVSLEKKDYQGDTLISWRENYNFDISKDYEVITKKDSEILVLKVKNNFTGMISILTFKLSEDENKTYLYISEDSELNNVFYRGLKVLAGKEAYVNAQIKWIRVGLYNYLITK